MWSETVGQHIIENELQRPVLSGARRKYGKKSNVYTTRFTCQNMQLQGVADILMPQHAFATILDDNCVSILEFTQRCVTPVLLGDDT